MKKGGTVRSPFLSAGTEYRVPPFEESMRYVFGPVPSRRLGRSLGIDPIPSKTCNWNCIYCQLGRTSPLVNERREYYSREEIIAEVAGALARHKPGEIDWITFAGSGEPTLHSGLGWMIERIKAMTSIPVAVLTNGSLLHLEEVRRELMPADAVMPSIDAGSEDLYLRINRAHTAVTFDRLVAGLKEFRRTYRGRLWVEVMLIKGLNDTEAALADLARVLEAVKPDAVHLGLPTRPPAEPDVMPSDDEGLMRAVAVLGRTAEVVRPADCAPDLASEPDPAAALMDIIARHPVSEAELVRWLGRAGFQGPRVEAVLSALASSGRVAVIERFGSRFWAPSDGRYKK